MNVKELQRQYGSPIYVYSQVILDEQCKKMKEFENELRKFLPDRINVSLHYSTKANANPAVLKTVKKHGLKVDCMSPGELYINEKCGFMPEEILYVCNNIKANEIELIHKKGILMCLDSISQVETYGKMFSGTDIMIRINPGIEGVGHSKKVITSGSTTKFGICEDNFQELFDVVDKYDLHIKGVHWHAGSLFLNDKVPQYINVVKAGLDKVKTYFKDVEIIDLGGGFGVPYKPEEQELDLYYVAKELNPVLSTFVRDYPCIKEFKFEPGRYIPCEAGYLLGEVTAIKKENNIWYIGTNIGMEMLVRPSMYDAYHNITLPESEGDEIIANFCGDVCESSDILGKDRSVALPKEGEAVVVHNVGAYGYSMASNYTGRPRPAEILVLSNGETKLLRKEESIEDMTKNLCWENINNLY